VKRRRRGVLASVIRNNSDLHPSKTTRFSTTAANAFELGREKLVTLIRRRLDVRIISVTTATHEMCTVHAVANEAAAVSLSAASSFGGNRERS
jgi:hypothetical protein